MFEVRQTQVFIDWMHSLKETPRAIVAARVARFEQSNLGEHKVIDEGLSELRIDAGPGNRLYTCARAAPCTSCCVAATKVGRRVTSSERNKWRRRLK